MRKKINLNYDWYFKEEYKKEDLTLGLFDGFIKVELPHTQKLLPYNYFNLEDYLFDSSYKKNIDIDIKDNKAYLLEFLGIAQASEIYINGTHVLTNNCGYNTILLDITKYIKNGQNEVYLKVSSKEGDFPPFGNIVDYLGYGGIYREVYLYEVNKTYLMNPFIYETDLLNDHRKLHFSTEFSDESKHFINLLINDDKNIIIDKTIYVESGIEYLLDLNKPELWSPNNPKLYDAKISLLDNKKIVDEISFKYGFRDIKPSLTGELILNGERFKIRGLDRHQSFPYVGYAMPIDMQIRDIHILKEDLGVNTMRCSHYMNHPRVLDECDKLGIIVYEEFPGWQHIGKGDWKAQAIDNLDSMILRDRNHPSIFFFGVRINESNDDFKFNEDCYLRAKELDPSRFITGTRCITKGLDFDDVYAFNNFPQNLTTKPLLDKSKVTKKNNPYLITEYLGHMYPNKPYDTEHRRVRASIIHKNVISQVEKMDDIMGSIGWVFSDYNTHKGFGPNDMICYHGVMDMFRNPKLSSYTFSAMRERPFLECSSDFAMGDYNAMRYEPIMIYTNLDKVEIYDNDGELLETHLINDSIDSRVFMFTDIYGNKLKTIEKLPDEDIEIIKRNTKLTFEYSYDEAKLNKLIDKNFNDITVSLMYKYLIDPNRVYRIVGYKDSKIVKEIKRGMPHFDHFDVDLSSNDLIIKDTYNVIELTVSSKSNFDSVLRYMVDTIKVEVSDGLSIIGDTERSIIGGYASFYIRNKYNRQSKENIKILTNRSNPIIINLNVLKE